MENSKLAAILPNAEALLEKGSNGLFFGNLVSELSREDLLILIGFLGETHVFQAGQLAQAAYNEQSLIGALRRI